MSTVRPSPAGSAPAAATPGPPCHCAHGDCEAIRPGLVGQPANTSSSAAYLVAAAVVANSRGARRRAWATGIAAVGLGSIAYHGPGTPVAKRLHDGALVVLGLCTAASVTGPALGVGRVGSPSRHARPAALIGGVAVAVHALSRSGTPGCRPRSRWQGHALWHVLSATALAVYAVGETAR